MTDTMSGYTCRGCGQRLTIPGTIEETRREARKLGWKVRTEKKGGHKGAVYCPDCRRRIQ